MAISAEKLSNPAAYKLYAEMGRVTVDYLQGLVDSPSGTVIQEDLEQLHDDLSLLSIVLERFSDYERVVRNGNEFYFKKNEKGLDTYTIELDGAMQIEKALRNYLNTLIEICGKYELRIGAHVADLKKNLP